MHKTKKTDFSLFYLFVHPPGLEPGLMVPQTIVLSLKLWVLELWYCTLNQEIRQEILIEL